MEQLRRLAAGQDLAVTTLLGSDASEQRLYELAQAGELKTYKYLHLATHGLANDQLHLQSKLILSRDRLPDPLEQIKAGQPVFRGELTAETILQTWHLNAELVVMSACQTGLGQFTQSEGYLGLTQPLLLVGARSVVVSLWNVEDTATALLMSRFYENLWTLRAGVEPMDKVLALHEAKQWLRQLTHDEVKQWLQSQGERGVQPSRQPEAATAPLAPVTHPYDHPHYWAAFILVGDWH